MSNKNLEEKFGNNVIGQVVRILNDHTIIIDAGKDEGVELNDTIQIYDYLGELKNINGDNLGPLEYIKAEVYVKKLEKRYSICETAKTSFINLGSISPLLDNTEEEHFLLNVDESQISPLVPKNKIIQLGDPVRFAEL